MQGGFFWVWWEGGCNGLGHSHVVLTIHAFILLGANSSIVPSLPFCLRTIFEVLGIMSAEAGGIPPHWAHH